MKLECIHGYFIFSETKAGQMSDFMARFGFEIERSSRGDHFTFADLVDAPDYSLPGGLFLGAPTTEAFEGSPWEVMRENGLVYDFSRGLVVPVLTINQQTPLKAAGNFFVTTGMILPGSVTDGGERVTDYSALFLESRLGFKYSEVGYL